MIFPSGTPDQRFREFMFDVVRYLLRCGSQRDGAFPTGSPEVVGVRERYWENFFHTAEVIEALALFRHHFRNDKAAEAQELLAQIDHAAIEVFHYFENGQSDGQWGTHVETCRVLYAYVRTAPLFPSIPDISPHLVFKALRWLCDEKQHFADHSFMHTMFITIFFALAILEVYRCWPPAQRTIEEIYDDIVWFTPARTTAERSERLKVVLENDRLHRQLEKLESRHATVVRVAWTVAAVVLIGIGTGLFAATIGFMKVQCSLDMTVKPADLWKVVSVVVAVLGLVVGAIWRLRIGRAR
jgi:hypothetical protein